MKILLTLFLLVNISYAKSYYAKVEPYEIRNISSMVSGLVLFVNENELGKVLGKKAYIRIDSELDKKELLYINEKLIYLRAMVSSNQIVMQNQERSLEKKRANYKRIEGLSFKSDVEKDREFHSLISSENTYLNIQKEINNLNIQITDLKLRKVRLEKSIRDKYVTDAGFVLYETLVKVGQVVGVSTPLAKIANISKAKLSIFLNPQDVKGVEKKVVYIDGKKTTYKVSRSLNIADSINISKYKAQIIIKAPRLFSKLVIVELKDN